MSGSEKIQKENSKETLIANMGAPEKASRPRVLGGITVQANTGCGHMYVQLNWRGDRLFEMFATLGKSGLCSMCFSESLTRSITSGLRYGVPITEYIEQLQGMRCPNPSPFPKEHASFSCPDALARILKNYGMKSFEQIIDLIRTNNIIRADGSIEPVQLSEEEERALAIEVMEEQKAERERLGLND